ncbi:neurogenic locus notch homolog protein 3-like isoform X2 [Folsomia candida]|uniref:neurogenic locus notch homolog protein 3-like isoform X2 n=1 Tax=Folsomia candida TaxID=158441 RepID=UPI0016051AB2|nr:neurogenic locus notch homolog protein 3-like isoform X2 [Folsomia candida]
MGFKTEPIAGIWTILHVCWVLSSVVIVITSGSVSQWSPNLELFEIIPSPDNTTEQVRPVPRRKNSEIVVGEDVGPHSRLVIKCNATFPVQIVYIGAGRPEFTTFTNVQWKEDPQMPLTFEAEASLGLLGFQGALRSEDTGNYTCRSIQNATIHSYFYIYVPGPSLFTPPDDYNSEIYFTPRDKQVWIPCAVASSKAVVSLHKTLAGKLQCPEIGRNVASYDPHKGFLLNLKDSSLKKPEGIYLCIGSQNNENFRMMEYKLIPTNNNQSESGKHPCRPSPCGQKAECSVIDGHPVCYCFRGLSGNPYSECSPNKDRCHSNAECSGGQFCVQGKCTNDPCHPSPCGRGSTCVSQGGRPRCACQLGYDGKPPYCLRRCQFHGDCPQNEICSRTHCQDPCPHRCGTNADCHVVQSGYNRTALCTCPPGRTGDPEENCYDIGTDPDEHKTHCPLGFIGPGPPDCRRKECSENYDCPPNHYCTSDKRCVDSGPDQCGRICGMNAICQLSRSIGSSSSKPVCQCPSWTTGDPLVRCFNLTTTTTTSTSHQRPQDPCNSNPCPHNTVCEAKYFLSRNGAKTEVNCVCAPGTVGRSPNCFPSSSPTFPTSIAVPVSPPQSDQRPINAPPHQQPSRHCLDDPDCPRGFECVGRVCIPEEEKPQCRRRCGLNAKCIGTQCVCPKNTVGDPHVACRAERTPCQPSPCANFAECREINGRAACRCILGYEGDAFTRCAPSSSSDNDGRRDQEGFNGGGGGQTSGRPQQSGPPFTPGFVEDEYYSIHSRFPGSSRPPTTAVPPSFNNQDPFSWRDNQPLQSSVGGKAMINRRDECDMGRPEDCGPPDYKCRRGRDGVARCVCSSHRCGYTADSPRPEGLPEGVIYGRYCKENQDCRYPEICSNVTLNCYNPCDFDHSPCAHVAFSECRVIEAQALCTCRRGYVGSPASGLDCRRDFGSSTEQQNSVSTSGSDNLPVVHCDYEKGIGCDTKSECQLVEGRGQCVCGTGHSGDYPDCRLRCKTNRDCFNAHECWRDECRDPCERAPCGSNAFCRVIDHKSTCECNPKFIGDPWDGCRPNPDQKQKGFNLKCDGAKCSFF